MVDQVRGGLDHAGLPAFEFDRLHLSFLHGATGTAVRVFDGDLVGKERKVEHDERIRCAPAHGASVRVRVARRSGPVSGFPVGRWCWITCPTAISAGRA